MKHYDVNSKKFIKNVVSLSVSALLLAAATFAWFATGTDVSVDTVSASIEGVFQIDIMHLDLSNTSTFLDGAVSGLTIRDRSGENEVVTSIADYVTGATGWASSSGSAWNISSMYPGEYGAYKISYTSDGSAKNLILDTVTCANTDAANSIYVYALVCKTGTQAGDTPQSITTVVSSLKSLMDAANGNIINVISNISSNRGEKIDIYYVIGMPATDNAGVHDALRQTGATVSIQKVDVISVS